MSTAVATVEHQTTDRPHWPDGGLRPYRMTVDVYEKLVASGVLGSSSVFLWKGQLVHPMVKGPNHEISVACANTLMIRIVPDGWHVRPGSPVRIPDDSEPEPDLLVVRGAIRDYKGRTPSGADVALAVEVSDSSLGYDSGPKLTAYAEAGIAAYWVVDIPGRAVHVYTGPSGPSPSPQYRSHARFGPDDEIPVVLDGREVGRIRASDVLP